MIPNCPLETIWPGQAKVTLFCSGGEFKLGFSPYLSSTCGYLWEILFTPQFLPVVRSEFDRINFTLIGLNLILINFSGTVEVSPGT